MSVHPQLYQVDIGLPLPHQIPAIVGEVRMIHSQLIDNPHFLPPQRHVLHAGTAHHPVSVQGVLGEDDAGVGFGWGHGGRLP